MPEWWHQTAQRLDLIGRLARHNNWDNPPRWLPLTLLLFPVLLLALAFLITALR